MAQIFIPGLRFYFNTFARLKYVFIILVTTGILLQSFSKIIILVNFQINRDYISKNLCVQRDKKHNCCKGSCHLKKSLEADDKKQDAPGPNFKNLKEFQTYCQANSLFEFSDKAVLIFKYCRIANPAVASVSFSIFHPPKA